MQPTLTFVQHTSQAPLGPVSNFTTASTVPLPVALDSLKTTMQRVLHEFTDAIREIPCVEQVRAYIAGSYMHIVIYVNQSTREERFQIYDIEKAFYRKYPYLDFEFDLIDRQNHPIDQHPTEEKHTEVIRIRDAGVPVS